MDSYSTNHQQPISNSILLMIKEQIMSFHIIRILSANRPDEHQTIFHFWKSGVSAGNGLERDSVRRIL